MEARSPAEVLAFTSDVGVAKANRKFLATLILSFFAGAFIAFAAQGSNMAAFQLLNAGAVSFGVGRLVAGVVFGTGLMMVLLAGAELFTGNMLIVVAALDKKVQIRQMVMNWVVVYLGNLLGSLFIAWMMAQSGLFNMQPGVDHPYGGAGLLGGMTIRIAYLKSVLPFGQAFFLGILCNWLVCIAVWVSFAAKDVIGKIFATFFIISLFVVSGFEHSIANMYYIPAGIFAKANPLWLKMALPQAWAEAGRTVSLFTDNVTWYSFFVRNLIPVTLGNMVGGLVFVGGLYWLALGKKK